MNKPIHNICLININEEKKKFNAGAMTGLQSGITKDGTNYYGYVILMTQNSLGKSSFFSQSVSQLTHEFKKIIENAGYKQIHKEKFEMLHDKNVYVRIRIFKFYDNLRICPRPFVVPSLKKKVIDSSINSA